MGFSINEKELLAAGERIYNLTRMFNTREGFTKKDDNMCERFTTPMKDMGWYVPIQDFEKMLDEYYELRGWDNETGIPKKEKLKELLIFNKA
jgi:aldehyde:ferredoxin oxidoreductase